MPGETSLRQLDSCRQRLAGSGTDDPVTQGRQARPLRVGESEIVEIDARPQARHGCLLFAPEPVVACAQFPTEGMVLKLPYGTSFSVIQVTVQA